jgi:hypothetical protein
MRSEVFLFLMKAPRRPRQMPRSGLAGVHATIAFHSIKNSQPRKQHWSAILSGIDQQVYCQPIPGDRAALWAG